MLISNFVNLSKRPDSGVIDINSQFDQSYKVPSRPVSRNSFTLQQLKINSSRIPNPKRSREEIRFQSSNKNGSSTSASQENNIGLAGLKISTKPRCTPVTILSSLKKERISCTCSVCEDRKEKVCTLCCSKNVNTEQSVYFLAQKRRLNYAYF